MKTTFTNLLLLCLCVGLGPSVLAQRTAEINVRSTEFKKSRMDALTMPIDADPDKVMDLWDEFWDDRYDIDVDKFDKDKIGTSYLAEQVNVPIISSKSFDLYSKIGGGGERSTVSMAVAFTENDIVNRDSHRESYDAAESIMGEFRSYFYEKYFGEMLEEARDDLADIRDDSQDASDDAQKARKKIDKYEEKIAKYEEKIQDLRDEVGDELETAEEKAARAQELESRVREIEQLRARYL